MCKQILQQYVNSDDVEELVEKALGFINEALVGVNKSLSNSMRWKLRDIRKEIKVIKSGKHRCTRGTNKIK